MSSTGPTIIILTSVYAVTLFFNLIYFKSEKRLHKALNAYAAMTKHADDEKFCLNDAECEITEEDLEDAAEALFADEDWSW